MPAGLRRTTVLGKSSFLYEGRNQRLPWLRNRARRAKKRSRPPTEPAPRRKVCILEKSGYFSRVELEPIVEIVQVDGVLGVTVGQSIGGKNSLTGRVVMIVPGNRIIEGSDRSGVQFDSWLFLDPCLELGIGGLGTGDKKSERLRH